MSLFFSDVDNTLIVKGETFSDELKQGMKNVIAKNHEFVLCSGRPTINLINNAKLLKAEGVVLNYVSGFNGAEIYDLNTDEIIYSKGLSQKEVMEITSVLEANEVAYLGYEDNKIISLTPENEYTIFEAELNELQIEKKPITKGSVKILGLTKPELMAEKLQTIKIELPNYEIINSTPFFIEITKKGVNKGLGLTQMAKLLNYDLDDTYVFGDALNDYAMFEIAKNRVVVANAVCELKKLATIEILDVKEDGVAKFLNKF